MTLILGSLQTRRTAINGSKFVKVRDVLKLLRSDGWILRNQEGSHRQFIHPHKPGKVTVAGHESDVMPPKTLESIMKQADIP